MSTATTRTAKTKREPLRFAHPFFTSTPPERRAPIPPFGRRMLDHIQGTLHAIPKPASDPVMTLADIIGTQGANDIDNAGTLIFHTVGDTGRGKDSPQETVAEAMATDFDAAHPEKSPAFLFHLGDVIYGPQKDQAYRTEFYEPYEHYPGKIIAIPGNHDGETFPTTDPSSLKAYRANFCAASAVVPPIAGSIFRQTMTMPGVYWLLDAPFVDIIGLYSNSAENPGFVSGQIPGAHQKAFLLAKLNKIATERGQGKRKGLIIATHHPPFSSGGHSGSQAMLDDIDNACQTAGVMPDVFFAAHAHNYQRYTRRVTLNGRLMQIPFVVAGMGGRNNGTVQAATGQVEGDHTFVASRRGFGYATVEATVGTLTIRSIGVDPDTGAKSNVDQVTVDLATNAIS